MHAMRIHYYAQGTKAAPWLDLLRAALPGAEVAEWVPGAPPADYVVVWAPPQSRQRAVSAVAIGLIRGPADAGRRSCAHRPSTGASGGR